MEADLPPAIAQHPQRASQGDSRGAVISTDGGAIRHEGDVRSGDCHLELIKRREDVRQPIGRLEHVTLGVHTTRGAELEEVVSDELRQALPRPPDRRIEQRLLERAERCGIQQSAPHPQ